MDRPISALQRIALADGRVDVGLLVQKAQFGREHSNNGVAAAVQGDGCAQRRAARFPPLPPQAIANNGYGCSAMPVFLIGELPAQRQLDAKCLEETRRDIDPDNMFRHAGIRQIVSLRHEAAMC